MNIAQNAHALRTLIARLAPAPRLGADNDDLPESSSYRTVTPMACTIHVGAGTARVVPWVIDYKRWNDPARNKFFATAPEIEHKVG